VNGGDTWTIISQWTASTLNPLSFDQEISAVAGYSQVKFKWNFTGTWGYYWDIDDVSITSQSSSPPDTPVLASPSNGSSTLDRTPSFDWSDVSEATSYNIQVDNNSDFASPEINQSVASSNYTPASDLALDTYYWRVNASSSNGSSPYSSSRTITIEAETAYTLPFTEDFNASTSLPTDWTQQNSSGVTDRWSVSVTTNAGGTTNEMKCVYQQINPGTTRLVTPLLDTDGCSSLDLSFKYLLDDYAVGATLLIQSSSDGTNWTNEAWSLATASNNLVGPGTINTTVTNNVGSGTYVAFVITGDLYQFDNWYVDDISITSEAPVISPTATTLAAGSVTTGSASLNGIINANGESTTVSFEYGLTTGYGYTSGGVPSTVTGTTDTSVYANISGLTQNTMYNYRLKAVSAGGTAYGTNMTFTTDQSVTSVDPPTDLSALANGSNVSLSWTAPVGSSPDPDTLSDGFETYANFTLDFTPWTQIDGDGSATYGSNDAAFENENYTGAYIIFNPSAATPALAGNWGAHSGSKYVACFAAQTPSNDDWLISPQLLIGSNYNLNFYAKSVTDQYGLERFKVSISTTGTNTGDFSVISSGSYVEVPISWTNYNYDLSAYEGQEIYIAITCVSNDAFVFMVDDISVNNAKSEIVLKKGFEKGREVLRTPVGKTRYLGIDSPQADFSPPATRDVKSNLTGFKVYRNSNLLATIYNPLDLTYFDAGLTDGSYSYNVTATYNDPVQESNPSNTEYVTISNEYVIDSFPWNESFEKLTFAPDEWEVQSSSANTWAETIGYTIGETTVSPVDGSKFAYVQWHGTDSQDEWLITPPIDLSSIGTPELSFWFNGSYYYSVDPEPNAMLKVMQKVDGGSWTEIWKASDH
ncbi:MAG: choice-of-anchor J domain-containing protein, partial [Candidatus Delongbacteria bacterium]|nr:choice-of-anchor J domain-containing protein [Candidatus Delongbacteria bacterium]